MPAGDMFEKLKQARTSSTYPHPSQFWPEGSLCEILTADDISGELYPHTGNQAPPAVDTKLVQFILQHGTKLLATCYISRIQQQYLKDTMIVFKRNKFNDKNLPVKKHDLSQFANLLPWDGQQEEDFFGNQWKFIAPTFPMNRCLIPDPLPEETIHPFTKSSPQAEGNFGIVYRVTVHYKHFDRNDPIHEAHNQVAIKEVVLTGNQYESLKPGQDTSAGRERGALLHVLSLKNKTPDLVEHIIDVKTIFDQGHKRYYMFPWADGGDLWEFWESRPVTQCQRDNEFIADIFEQLLGLASALLVLHQGNCRHGDLKPENILIFKYRNQPDTWKIADLGLARFHDDPTRKRKGPTSTHHGTVSYEPPELAHDDQPTSRLYDIWSIGCIILQLITWLLYDIPGVNQLTESTRDRHRKESTFWSQKSTSEAWSEPGVHDKVISQMEKIMRDATGSQALRDLLEVVRDKLLVVQLPTDSEQGWRKGLRANAQTLHDELCKIAERGRSDKEYWSTGGTLFRRPANALPLATGSFGPGHSDYHHPTLNEDWKFTVDNSFAKCIISNNQVLETTKSRMRPTPSEELCLKCQRVKFDLPIFEITDVLVELKSSSTSCDFCLMRWNSCKHLEFENVSKVYFDRSGSNLRLNKTYPPVMTILRRPDLKYMDEDAMGPLQIGFPHLPETEDPFKFDILRKWLRDCDEHHESCLPQGSSQVLLPKRLIDVADKCSPVVRLHGTQAGDNMRYLALSHPWGDPPHFCTYPDNIEEYSNGIRLTDIPKTFRDAIDVTRMLGFQYLWIDSLCIIQGQYGDFASEGKRMEDVFSNAYCVLAASCAESQRDGFLNPVQQRDSVAICQPGQDPVYVCEFMDNFDEHVLNSRLNQRGWVLQERVLARRTIYFSRKQIYWECGRGVRCESMTKMQNGLVSFSGDPHFPELAIEASRGGKIRIYQDLYSKYTRLSLSRDTDRPVAIAGLEKRLINSFQVSGGFGIFDGAGSGLLRRSLSWCRAPDVGRLEMMDFQSVNSPASPVSSPPTWSWMAYKGAIRYLDIPFGRVEWEENEIRSPWSGRPAGTWTYSRDRSSDRPALTVTVRPFCSQAAYELGDALILDDPTSWAALASTIKCVDFGRLKNEDQDLEENVLHYVLLVAPTDSNGLQYNLAYKRVGVGIIRDSLFLKTGQGSRERVL